MLLAAKDTINNVKEIVILHKKESRTIFGLQKQNKTKNYKLKGFIDK